MGIIQKGRQQFNDYKFTKRKSGTMVELIYRKGRLIIRGRYFKYIFFLICGIFHEQKRNQPNIDINCCAHSIWDVSCRLARLSVLALRCAFPLAILHVSTKCALLRFTLKKKKLLLFRLKLFHTGGGEKAAYATGGYWSWGVCRLLSFNSGPRSEAGGRGGERESAPQVERGG